MLTRSNRLTRNEFALLAGAGRVVHSRHLSLRFTSRQAEIPLFSFVISGKVAPRAVDRNLLKRRGRAIVKAVLPRVAPKTVGAFFFKKGARELSYQELSREMTDLLVAARIITNE